MTISAQHLYAHHIVCCHCFPLGILLVLLLLSEFCYFGYIFKRIFLFLQVGDPRACERRAGPRSSGGAGENPTECRGGGKVREIRLPRRPYSGELPLCVPVHRKREVGTPTLLVVKRVGLSYTGGEKEGIDGEKVGEGDINGEKEEEEILMEKRRGRRRH